MTSPFSPEFHQAWADLSAKLEPDRPSVGKTVKVVKGRKHLGVTGKVIWHGEDTFDDSTRYLDSAQLYLREIEGRRGYRIRIESETEGKFFLNADYVEVLQ